MTIKQLPAAPVAPARTDISCEIAPSALARWNPSIQAAASDAETISIFDQIGMDPWTGEGVTAKRIAGILRAIGEKDVVVSINSPGGNMFEGMAIYNLLREHKGKVTVKVVGVAASAASIIAMAGDEIQIGRAGFFMIHNAWMTAIGNRLELREIADWLEPFDAAMADIYAARSGVELKEVVKLLDAESWIGGAAAVEQGFADSLLAADEITEGDQPDNPNAAHRLDLILARQGMPRSERRKLIQEIKTGTPGATGTGTPGAVEKAEVAKATTELLGALVRLHAAGISST